MGSNLLELHCCAISEWPTIRPEGALSEVYTPEATREELAAAVGQVLDILSDDEEEDE